MNDEPVPNNSSAAQIEELKEVTFHYLKSNDFRVIHCDGAVGAWSPNGKFLHMAIFSERIPIPIESLHKVEKGVLGEEIRQTGRQGVVREIDADLVMSVDIAERLGKWLLSQVNGHPNRPCKEHCVS